MNAMILSLTNAMPAPAGLVDYLTEYAELRRCPRRTVLLRAGDVGRKIFFVEWGLLRKYYTDGDAREISSGFTAEDGICLSVESWLTGQASHETIEVLEDSLVSSLDRDDLSYMMREWPVIGGQYLKGLEQSMVEMSRRLRAMWMRPAEERYRWLANRSPAWFDRVQGRHLASYLGMTEVTLSSIRGRIRRGKEDTAGMTAAEY